MTRPTIQETTDGRIIVSKLRDISEAPKHDWANPVLIFYTVGIDNGSRDYPPVLVR